MSGKIWLEAESFDSLGGWVIDTQSIHVMGSAYIMAHGMGIPVKDAETCLEIPCAGVWHVWARTRNWTAVWGRGSAAGQFKVSINNTELSEILGTCDSGWSWQKAGSVELPTGEAKVALHDLTGFNGRCDALYFTLDPDEVPENDPEKLLAMRQEFCGFEEDETEYDLLVAGGGAAGLCTAVSAIRHGLKTALIQDREVLGGCNSSEVRVSMGGIVNLPPYQNLGNVVREIAPIMGDGNTYPKECYEDERKKNIFCLCNPEDYTLSLGERVLTVEKNPANEKKISSVITVNCRTGKFRRYKAKMFSDCTGDAFLARQMGAEVMYGREKRSQFDESLAPVEADRQVMGMSVIWFSRKTEEATAFPDIDWGLEFNENNAYFIRGGDWEWEAGQYRDQADEAEYIRDYALMALFANWSFLKNRSSRKDEWAHDTLHWVSATGGKRESYRVVGDYVLNQKDIEEHREIEDATGPISWNIDLHFPDPENTAKFEEPFRSCAYHRGIGKVYQVPYRCLYARDVDNLFLGGRDISLSHIAFSCARVMRTLGMLGEVVGMAASICLTNIIKPGELFPKYFDQLKSLMEKGVPVPTYHPGRNPAIEEDFMESYHFKDTRHIVFKDDSDLEKIDPNTQARIKALGMHHRCHG